MNLSIIQKSIDYIEDNLKTDITAKELSEMAGFYKAFIREFEAIKKMTEWMLQKFHDMIFE